MLLVLSSCFCVYGQGWYAEIDLDFDHELYAYESISKATLSFSGVTVTGSSAISNLSLVVKGTGPITGDIVLSVNGQAWAPYDEMRPYNEPIAAHFTGKYTIPCQTGFFEKAGNNAHQQIYVWVRIYPRLQISSFVQLCESITLKSDTCSPSYLWEVSDSPIGNFKTIAGKSTASIIITRGELLGLGFLNPYGRKYFRVTGRPNTVSLVQPVDVFYPSPSASISAVAPRCHNGADGSITLEITSSNPSAIDDFVVTLFKAVPPQEPLIQDYITDGFHKKFSNLGAGNYWVRIENNTNKDVYGNCWTDYPVPALANPELVSLQASVSVYNGYGVSCSGATDGRIDVTASGGTGQYIAYEWSADVAATMTATGLPAGVYSARVSDSFGCWSQPVTAEVTEPTMLSVNILSTGGKNGFDVSCHDKTDGSIDAEVSGGVPGYSYLWSQSSTTASISALGPGDYTVTVEDANGCSVTGAATLKAPEPIRFDINEINGISCPGEQSGAMEITSPANTIGELSFAWSSGEQTSVITGKGAGTYVATVSDGQGCSASATHELEEPLPYSAEIISLSDYNGSAIRCNGEATGKVQAILRDPDGQVVTAGYYSWFRNGVSYKSGNGLSELSDVSAGVYYAEIRYTSFCKAEASMTLMEPEPLVVFITTISDYNGSAISCAGKADGHIRAEASGGTGALSYEWNTGTFNPELKSIGAGLYGLVVSDANGCATQSEMTLEDPVPLEAIATVVSDYNGQPLSCFGSSDARLTAGATGGTQPYAFKWSTGQEGEILSDIPAGNYALLATDLNGCLSNEEITITAPSQVLVTIGEHSDYHGYGTSCNGSSDGSLLAAATGGTGEYQFAWSARGVTTARLTDVGAGQYTVTVRDTNGCTNKSDAVITEPEPLSLFVDQFKNVSCPGGSDGAMMVSAYGGAGSYMFSLTASGWQGEPTFIGLRSGVYNATVMDANSCRATNVQELNEPDPIVIEFDNVLPALCGDPKGKASVIARGGTGGYDYVWRNIAGDTVSRGSHVSGVLAGIYRVAVRDQHLCEATSSVGITSTNGPRANVVEINGTTCSYTEDGKAQIEISEGNAPFTILWEDGQSSAEAVALAKGRHHVKITDVNNCAVVETIEIPSPETLQVDVIERIEPRCYGSCDGYIKVGASGGNGQYNFSWGSSSASTLEQLCAGVYEVTVTDLNDCITSKTINLGEPSAIMINPIVRKSPACPGSCDGEVAVEASGGTGILDFVWSDGSNDAGLDNVCSGTYTVTVTDTHSCFTQETFSLHPPEVQTLDIGESATLCQGQTHTIDGGDGWSQFVWTSDNGFESSARVVDLSDAGTYNLVATDVNGCVARDTFILQTSTELLQAMFLLASQAYTRDTVVIIDISWPIPDNVTWTIPKSMYVTQGDEDIMFGTFEEAGLYDISLSASLGECRDEMTKTIHILDIDKPTEQGRLGQDHFVKEFSLYPNPNEGKFDVVVAFEQETSMVLTVWNVLTSRKIAQVKGMGERYYHEHFDLSPLSAGSYSVRLDFGHGAKYIRFIVR